MIFFAILAIFFVVLVVETRLYKIVAAKAITYSICISTNEAFEGDTIQFIEEVSNRSWLPIPWLKTEIMVPMWLEFVGTTAHMKSGLRFVPSLFMLQPYQKCTRVWQVKCVKRGVYRLDDMRVHFTDLFGATISSMLVSVDDELTVLPTPYEIVPQNMSNKALYGEEIVRRFIIDDPFAVAGVSEYSGREPVNRVHWASTARTGRLMVLNNEYITSNQILVLMNFQMRSIGALSPASDAYIETAIKTMVVFLEKAKLSGNRITIITNSTGDDEPTEGGQIYHHSALQYLAGLKNDCDRDFSVMLEEIDVSPYTDVIVLSSYISPDICSAVNRFSSYKKNVLIYCNNSSEDGMPDVKVIPLGSYSHKSLLGGKTV